MKCTNGQRKFSLRTLNTLLYVQMLPLVTLIILGLSLERLYIYINRLYIVFISLSAMRFSSLAIKVRHAIKSFFFSREKARNNDNIFRCYHRHGMLWPRYTYPVANHRNIAHISSRFLNESYRNVKKSQRTVSCLSSTYFVILKSCI